MVNGSASLDTQSTPVATGCKIVTTCTNPLVPNYFCPINTDACLKINCSGAGDAISAKTGCIFQGNDVGISCPAASCVGNALVTSYNTAIDPDYDCLQTQTTCEACRQKRMQEILESPQITIPANEAYKCYNFESYKKSVNNFLTNYNAQATSDLKSGLFTSDIKVISDYDNNYGFGNFENHKPVDQFGNLELKDSIKFLNVGVINQLMVTNSDFKTFNSDVFGATPSALKAQAGVVDIGARRTNIQAAAKVTSEGTQGSYSNGEKLVVSLCKENVKDGVICKSGDGIALVSNPQAGTSPKSLGLYTGNTPSSVDKFAFDSKGILRRVSADAVGTAVNCDATTVNDNFICFKNDLGNAGEIEKYRLSFAVKMDSGSISNEKGFYEIKIEKRNPTSTRSGGVVDNILRPIITNLDGAKIDDPNIPGDQSRGIAEDFYRKLIKHPLYRNILTLVMVLSFSFYGMGYLMGINEFKNSEIVKILLKVGFIYLFTSTTSGWVWFEKFFVEFFKNAVDFITFSVAETFDSANSGEYRAKIFASDYYDKAILFKSVDKVVDLILSAVVQKKILALLFSSIFGWIYFLMLYYCLLTYVYAIANAMLLYITCQIVVSILFVLGPIFFVFLMFKVTKDMFDNWIKALIGFSLQQIFLIMTLSLFNTFVVAFLKLSLGYRICWSNVLSINILYSKISLLNFWIVAGTNSPEAGMEDAPEDSFGSDSNMPSLYLFLYLLTTVSLMKQFIELFTNLAVSLSGGLKASTIGADAASVAKDFAKKVGAKASQAYGGTIGRVVSNADNFFFDSGSIADSKRAEERKNFATDMKTKATLVMQGNDAVSKYKKENALEFAGMNSNEQKKTLENVRDKAMSKYASDNGISEAKLDQLKNSSGINYTGNNLFGALAQAGNQAVFSGGSLFNSIANKKVDTSFSKEEANAALKKMDGAGGEDKRNAFIEKVEQGNVKVNKGKIENARKVAISAVPRIVSAALNPKSTAQSALKVVSSPVSNALSSNRVKNEVIANLEKSGKISTIKSIAPSFLKNWARSDEDKKIIRDKTREVINQREDSFGKSQGNQTSRSVIKDLKTTSDYVKKTEENTGQDFSKSSERSFVANLGRFGSRVKNTMLTPPNFKPKENTKTQIVSPQTQDNLAKTRSDLEKQKMLETSGLDVLKNRDKLISEKIKEKSGDFHYLDKMKESLKENKENRKTPNEIDASLKKEIQQSGSDNVKKALEKIEKYNKDSKKLEKIDDLMQKELGNKGSDLISLVEQRKEGRAEINEKELNFKTLDHKIKVVDLSEKANAIKTKCNEDIDKYNEKRFKNNILGAVRKIWVHKAIPRALNMVAEGAVRGYRSVVNSPRNFITGGKDKLEAKGGYTSASAPVEKLISTKLYMKNVVNDAKKARKALKQFEKISSTKDLERFVTKFEHMVPKTNNSNTA
jgi:type IV secretory pathway VirB6-like protein